MSFTEELFYFCLYIFILLPAGVYVAVNQMDMDQNDSGDDSDQATIVAELEKSARKAEAKKNRQLVSIMQICPVGVY